MEDSARAEANYQNFVDTRLPHQIDVDGSNPYELARANSLLYSRYNLGRMLDLARLGSYRLDTIDLTEYSTEDGRSLRRAVDFLTPYLVGDVAWDHWHGNEFAREPGAYMELLRSAAVLFHDPYLLEQSNRLGYKALSYFNLRFPNAAVYETFVPGDTNLDGHFGSSDLVAVFTVGKYNLNEDASWLAGDWNGDWRFNSADFVHALQSSRYEVITSTSLVPEPSTFAPASGALLLLSARYRRSVVQR